MKRYQDPPEGIWRQEWRGKHEGMPYSAALWRSEVAGWRWRFRFNGRKTGPEGAAPTFDMALRTLRRIIENTLDLATGGGSR